MGALALWIGVGVIASGVAIGVHHEMSSREPAPPVSAAAATTAPRVDVVAAPPTTSSAQQEPAVPPAVPSQSAVRLPPPRPNARPRTAPMTSSSPASAASSSSVAAPTMGLRELIEIRGALRDHDPARALVLLDRLERADSSARLSEETTVLRIDALADLGRNEEAAALARTFLVRHPNSAYAARVRTKSSAP